MGKMLFVEIILLSFSSATGCNLHFRIYGVCDLRFCAFTISKILTKKNATDKTIFTPIQMKINNQMEKKKLRLLLDIRISSKLN